jgi:hypothetical protein
MTCALDRTHRQVTLAHWRTSCGRGAGSGQAQGKGSARARDLAVAGDEGKTFLPFEAPNARMN